MAGGSPPIACTLGAADLTARLDEISALGRDGLREVERDARRVTLRFRPGLEIRERVEAIAAAESRCCAFLDFSVTGERETVLSIEAPEGGEPIMHELADRFAS